MKPIYPATRNFYITECPVCRKTVEIEGESLMKGQRKICDNCGADLVVTFKKNEGWYIDTM